MKKPLKISLLVVLAIVLYYLLVPKYYFVKFNDRILKGNKITGNISDAFTPTLEDLFK